MKREEHKAAMNKLLGMVAPEHQGTASELLTNLTEDYEATLTASEQASENFQNLTRDYETLRKVNSKLFLKVGETEKETHKENHTTIDKPEGETPLSFDNLFNEKGDLI